ncbi:hypothetical protein Hypma_000670 [Hypsizygus marmoreus]|uniref:Uncharacterized protein n=1 Tax=Hypsizygus marmoreus TaxID=39966 RepID=A0A369JG47_HYPMA|nr:hypothetical protein Hypma_000670 [Hypsizygus marmoreus]
MSPTRSESSPSPAHSNELAHELAIYKKEEREAHRREVKAFFTRNNNERTRLGLGSPSPNPPSFVPDPTSPLNSNRAVLPVAASTSVPSSSPVINQDTLIRTVLLSFEFEGVREVHAGRSELHKFWARQHILH